ncbi:hypothetical protein ACLI1R_001828 [Corynebacterium sp. LaCa97]|uniref:hypothetical protein n=1 Tax=Corynebacterium sp. LaCa97 TaxID=3391431 RepID=UPI003989C738
MVERYLTSQRDAGFKVSTIWGSGPASRQDVAAQALAAPVPAVRESQQDGQSDQFVEDVKQALAELTTADEVTSFMQEIRNDGDVPEEVIDLGRRRWNELQGEKN